jgi:hypothetical protein
MYVWSNGFGEWGLAMRLLSCVYSRVEKLPRNIGCDLSGLFNQLMAMDHIPSMQYVSLIHCL